MFVVNTVHRDCFPLCPSRHERETARPQYLEALDADAWETPTASGGHREGDPIELMHLPSFDRGTGKTSACFLAHGVRHRSGSAGGVSAASVTGLI